MFGGYTEICGDDHKVVEIKPWRPWAPWRIYWCPATFKHRILKLHKECSWTLAFIGGKEREWGFYTKSGFMHWKKFIDAGLLGSVSWCEDESENNK